MAEGYSAKSTAPGLSYGGIRAYVSGSVTSVDGWTSRVTLGGHVEAIKISDWAIQWGGYVDGSNATGDQSGTANNSGSSWADVSGSYMSATRDIRQGNTARTVAVSSWCRFTNYQDSTIVWATTYVTIPARQSHTVTYDANGGTGAPSAQTKWYGDPLMLSSSVPTRENYRFDGWATSKGGSVAYRAGGTYGADADVTLYAVWTLLYKAPTVNYAKGFRVASADATAETTMGEFVRCQFDWSVDTSIYSDNTAASFAATATITAADDTATTATPTLSPTAPSGTSGTVYAVVACPTGSTASVTVTVTDSCEKAGSTSATGSVGTAHPPLEFANAGTSVGLLNSAPAAAGISLGGVTLTGVHDVVASGTAKRLANVLANEAVVLYSNNAGTKASFSLSESAANFEAIDVFFFDDVGSSKVDLSTRLYKPNGRIATLHGISTTSTTAQYAWSSWKFSAKSVTTLGECYININYGTSGGICWSKATSTQHIAVRAVIGYRKLA
jgi:uncharacterized repeat protein (TIGR02543 family)